MSQKLKIVFMGTPAFAVPALDSIVDAEYEVVAVYTQPPRPAGRGQKPTKSAVHNLAERLEIPVFTPETLKNDEEQNQLKKLKADLAVVVAYGMLLPRAVLDLFPQGCINIHPSLLPRWRGAAPIQRTLMAGDGETAVCIMQMNEGLDTGDVILTERLAIPSEMNAGDLHDTLSLIGADLTIKALGQIASGNAKRTPQPADGATYARKITKEEARIDWNKPAREINAMIRGLSPAPGAFCHYQDTPMKILQAELVDKKSAGGHKLGEVLDDQLTIATAEGALRPLVVVRPGKKAMSAEEMLRGSPIPPGTILE